MRRRWCSWLRHATCLVVLASAPANGKGPDPWDIRPTESPPPSAGAADGAAACGPPLGDIFFKKFLRGLVGRGHYEDVRNVFIAELRFEFRKGDVDLLKSLYENSVPLSAEELRKIDGLLADSVIEQSYAARTMELILEKYSESVHRYSIIIVSVLCLTLVCIFKHAFIIRILGAIFGAISIRSLIFLAFIVLYLWECKVALQLEENERLKEFYESLSPQTIMSWDYWFATSTKYKTEASIWEILHPAKILLKLFSKFITVPSIEFLDRLIDFSDKASDKFPYPINKIVYIVLIFLLTISTISIAFTFVWSVLLQRSMSLNLYGLSLHMKNSDSPFRKAETANRSEPPSIDKVGALIDICANLVNFAAENRTQAPAAIQITQRPSSREKVVFRQPKPLALGAISHSASETRRKSVGF